MYHYNHSINMSSPSNLFKLLCTTSYCISVQSHGKKTYFEFIKEIIQLYLNDTIQNYCIYISTTDKYKNLYQNVLPVHTKLIYVDDGLIPTSVADNVNHIYFHHRDSITYNKTDQIALINFMKTSHIKYIYVGCSNKIAKLIPYFRMVLFQYYLCFDSKASKWGSIRTPYDVPYGKKIKIPKLYYHQKEKVNKSTTSVTIYDYYLFHNIITGETTICKFNKKTVPGKSKTKPPTTTQPVPIATASTPIVQKQIKYIYTKDHYFKKHLVLPDGSTESFHNINAKYKDVIEI